VASAWCQSAEVTHHVIAAYVIQHHIHTAALGFILNNENKVFVMSVNGSTNTELLQRGDFIGTARGGEYLCSARLSALNRKGPDAAGSTMDQYGFTRLQTAQLEKVVPDGKCGFRHASGMIQRQAIRNAQAEFGTRDTIVGVSATTQ
jgi:hypothetical protein